MPSEKQSRSKRMFMLEMAPSAPGHTTVETTGVDPVTGRPTRHITVTGPPVTEAERSFVPQGPEDSPAAAAEEAEILHRAVGSSMTSGELELLRNLDKDWY